MTLRSGRFPASPCSPERCEVLRLRGEGRLPQPVGVRIVEVGEAVLNDRVLFGDFLAPTDNALAERRGEPFPRSRRGLSPAPAAAALPRRRCGDARRAPRARHDLPQLRLGIAAEGGSTAPLGDRRPRGGGGPRAIRAPVGDLELRPRRARAGAARRASDESCGGSPPRNRRRRGGGASVRVRAPGGDDAAHRPRGGPQAARLVRRARLADCARHRGRVGRDRGGGDGDRARGRRARGCVGRRTGGRPRPGRARSQRPLRRGAGSRPACCGRCDRCARRRCRGAGRSPWVRVRGRGGDRGGRTRRARARTRRRRRRPDAVAARARHVRCGGPRRAAAAAGAARCRAARPRALARSAARFALARAQPRLRGGRDLVPRRQLRPRALRRELPRDACARRARSGGASCAARLRRSRGPAAADSRPGCGVASSDSERSRSRGLRRCCG